MECFTTERFCSVLQSKIERGYSLVEAYKDIYISIVNKYKQNKEYIDKNTMNLNKALLMIQCELNL
jgi:hypothetical protein